MDDQQGTEGGPPGHRSLFAFAPPRHFLLPTVLLLLSEQPGYGYSLVRDLHELRFGPVDRPSVYRALAQLEKDGLVESWAEAPTAGPSRRVYGLTEQGSRALRAWMGVIKEERDCLDRVMRRYQATGSTDAVLAEVEGGWRTTLGPDWSPVSPTSPMGRPATPSACKLRTIRHSSGRSGTHGALEPGAATTGGTSAGGRLDGPAAARLATPPDQGVPTGDVPTGAGLAVAGDAASVAPTSFHVVPDRSVVMIEARSTVGPITFGAIGIRGVIEAEVADGIIRPGSRPSAKLELDVTGLKSGNRLYDVELLRRIDARRYPVVTMDLQDAVAVGAGNHHRVVGEVTFHGVTRPLEGTVALELSGPQKLVVTGEEVLDMRDFDLASPTVLMLRIYPDVRVHLHLEARQEL